MMPWRRLLPLLAGVALAMGGLALGSALQVENVLPADIRSQQVSVQREASGNVIFLTGVLVAAGAAMAAAALWARPSPRKDRLALLAVAGGAYLAANLVATIWPNAAGIDTGTTRLAVLRLSLLASNAPAVPSTLTPILAAGAGSLLLLGWGIARLRSGPALAVDRASLPRRRAGLALLATPFLGLAAWSCLRLVGALPDLPTATSFHVLLLLAAVAYLGLLGLEATKAWRLLRGIGDDDAADLFQGATRVQLGLVGLLAAVVAISFLLPPFPPDLTDCSRSVCAPNDPARLHGEDARDLAELLQSGHTFGSARLHLHLSLLLLSLVPLAPSLLLDRRSRRHGLVGTLPPPATARETAAWAGGLAASLALGGAATWFLEGALWGWVGALAPAAIAAAVVGPPRRAVQITLLLAWCAWAIGNTLRATYDTSGSGLSFQSDPSLLELWRLVGALLAALAVAQAVGATAGPVRASLAIPLRAGLVTVAIAVVLLEMPLHIWGDTFAYRSEASPPSVYMGTRVAQAGLAAAVVMHALAVGLALGGAILAARLVRPEWFTGKRRPTKASHPLPLAARAPTGQAGHAPR